ncbi:MAG TPA: DUF2946 family protein, partial [Rhodocyclaceae bacterium]|nr:DUF2946 family protein [Rhodocyclaceae bacterium]
MLSRRTLHRTSLLALFALLWGLLFPTLANAGIGKTNEVWAEICTAQGVKHVLQEAADSASNDAQPAVGHHYTTEHCALCCVGGVLAAIELPPLLDGVRLDVHVPVPPAFEAAP